MKEPLFYYEKFFWLKKETVKSKIIDGREVFFLKHILWLLMIELTINASALDTSQNRNTNE